LQLIINTGTTIVTFLMVFLVQNTQNRDAPRPSSQTKGPRTGAKRSDDAPGATIRLVSLFTPAQRFELPFDLIDLFVSAVLEIDEPVAGVFHTAQQFIEWR
jgi:hypothetical protein